MNLRSRRTALPEDATHLNKKRKVQHDSSKETTSSTISTSANHLEVSVPLSVPPTIVLEPLPSRAPTPDIQITETTDTSSRAPTPVVQTPASSNAPLETSDPFSGLQAIIADDADPGVSKLFGNAATDIYPCLLPYHTKDRPDVKPLNTLDLPDITKKPKSKCLICKFCLYVFTSLFRTDTQPYFRQNR